jgi:hypothetical protein
VVCAYLFLVRWINRPAPEPASWPGAKWFFWIAGFAFLPTWLVEQPNPDWRLISWLLTLEILSFLLQVGCGSTSFEDSRAVAPPGDLLPGGRLQALDG